MHLPMPIYLPHTALHLHPHLTVVIQIASSDEMKDLLLNPPDISPWNSTGLFKPPAVKKSSKKSAAWSGQRLKINQAATAPDGAAAAAPLASEEEVEAAYKAARVEARYKRRAAAAAEANLGLLGEEAARDPRVVNKAAVDRIASMIQVNVKKEASTLHDGAPALLPPVDNSASDAHDEPEMFPMAAASIETWGGLVMRCSQAGSSLRAADFG